MKQKDQSLIGGTEATKILPDTNKDIPVNPKIVANVNELSPPVMRNPIIGKIRIMKPSTIKTNPKSNLVYPFDRGNVGELSIWPI